MNSMHTTPSKGTYLPNFIVIGAMKCGTTSLYQYLSQHPEIFLSHVKELDFFVEEKNWNRGLEWYKSYFPISRKAVGECSPSYTSFPLWSGSAERIKSIIPETKLIYIVRDPIERILSHYKHVVASQKTTLSLGKEIKNNLCYIARSRYYLQISQYLNFFDKDQILIVDSKDLQTERVITMQKIFCFLNVDPTFRSVVFNFNYHQTRFKRIYPYTNNASIIKLQQMVASFFPRCISGPLVWLFNVPLSKKVPDIELSVDVKRYIIDKIQNDIQIFKKISGLAFNHWSI
jgi:hypothetical protein